MNEKISLHFISKKRLKLMVLFLFCTIILFVIYVSAEETAVLKVSQTAAKPGEIINVPLVLENNPGIAGLLIKIKYDASRLQLDGANSITRGTALSNLTYIGINEKTAVNNPFVVLWYGVTNNLENGVILNVKFNVLNNAPAGEAFISIIYEANDVVSDSGELVALSTQNAAVTIIRDNKYVEPPNNNPVFIICDEEMENISAISVPYENNGGEMAENLIVYHLDDSGVMKPVTKSKYDEKNGMMQFFGTAEESYIISPNKINFFDVSEKDWFFSAVSFVTARGLFEGIGNNLFAPSNTMTRAMFITVLARLDGADLSHYKTSPYSDIAINSWYGAAVAWATQTGIIDAGILSDCQAGTFKPGDNITREQMAVIFYNYIRLTELSLKKRETQDFADTEQASEGAKPAINSMRSHSIINGIGNNLYNPKGMATRAEVAQIFTNLIHAMIW